MVTIRIVHFRVFRVFRGYFLVRTLLTIAYLKATGFKLGLLVNFGHYPKVQLERIVAEQGRYCYAR